MPRLYFYKLISDNGGAPCVKDGLLSLAICKPMIRCSAEKGDLVFGFAASSLHRDNRLIYIAEIGENVSNGGYYDEPPFAGRADRVYERRAARFRWRRGARHHGPEDLVHDLGQPPDYPRAHVLVSNDFRYFGKDGTSSYKSSYPYIKRAVEGLGRGYRVRHDALLRRELIALKKTVWAGTRKRVAGEPTSLARSGVCHRTKSCGVISSDNAGEA